MSKSHFQVSRLWNITQAREREKAIDPLSSYAITTFRLCSLDMEKGKEKILIKAGFREKNPFLSSWNFIIFRTVLLKYQSSFCSATHTVEFWPFVCMHTEEKPEKSQIMYMYRERERTRQPFHNSYNHSVHYRAIERRSHSPTLLSYLVLTIKRPTSIMIVNNLIHAITYDTFYLF